MNGYSFWFVTQDNKTFVTSVRRYLNNTILKVIMLYNCHYICLTA